MTSLEYDVNGPSQVIHDNIGLLSTFTGHLCREFIGYRWIRWSFVGFSVVRFLTNSSVAGEIGRLKALKCAITPNERRSGMLHAPGALTCSHWPYLRPGKPYVWTTYTRPKYTYTGTNIWNPWHQLIYGLTLPVNEFNWVVLIYTYMHTLLEQLLDLYMYR